MSNDTVEPAGSVAIEVEASVPFADTENETKDFEIKEPLGRIDLLQDKITEALSQKVNVIVSYPSGLDTPVDDEHPAILYVDSASAFDGRTVRGVITSHCHDEAQAEIDQEARADLVGGLRERLEAGETLDLDEVSTVLRSLLG